MDFGCGYRRVANILHEEGVTDVHSVNISPAMLARLKKEHPHLAGNAKFYDAKTLLYDDDVFGGLIAFTVLNAVPEQAELENLFSEFSRVLKPRGALYI